MDKVDNIHITLAFLGDTEESVVKDLTMMLQEKCKGLTQFELILKGTGVFRNFFDPRIIWIGMEHRKGCCITMERLLVV